MAIKPMMTIFLGHDCNLTVWNPADDFMISYEFERVSQIKHHKSEDLNFEKVFNKVFNQLENRYGIKPEFDRVWIKPGNNLEYVQEIQRIFPNNQLIYLTPRDHHAAHAAGAFFSSPFEKASIIAWDGGGDVGSFHYYEYDGDLQYESTEMCYDFSRTYTDVGNGCDKFRKTRRLDIAGKLMGYSAYGQNHRDRKVTHRVTAYLKELMFTTTTPKSRLNRTYYTRRELKTFFPDKYKEGDGRSFLDGTPEVVACWAAQKAMEEGFIEVLHEKYIDRIREFGGNLILTGGSALNVLVNQKVHEEFPDINLWVPSDPHDGGLSAGMMFVEPYWENRDNRKDTDEFRPSRRDRKYEGPHVFDLEKLPKFIKDYSAKEVNHDEIVDLLKSGKIMGLVQGRCEIGPRALGNRSIICDPSFPNMKDIINKNVKFREWYRPFAPVCTLEDAPTYFEGDYFDRMDAMQFAPIVRKEYRESLSAITHVDNTARLQTVTEESNPNFYSLLKKFGGVLLNTSFNIQRRPILNTINDALWFLDNTGLDHVIVVDDEGKHWLF